MKRNLRRRLIAFLATGGVIAVAAGLLCACKIGEGSLQEDIDKYKLTSVVYYYANGGAFGLQASSAKEKEIYFQDGAPIFDLANGDKTDGNDDPNMTVLRRYGYDFAGWQYVALDENGAPKRTGSEEDKDGLVESSGEAVTFPLRAEKDKTLYLCASWIKQSWLNYELVLENPDGEVSPIQANVEDDFGVFTQTTVSGGERLFFTPFEGETLTVTDSEPSSVKAENASYVGIFKDKACTEEFGLGDDTLNRPANAGEDVTVYVKYFSGEWSIIKKASDVRKIFTGNAYVARDVDCSSEKIYLQSGVYSYHLIGNHKTITGITVNQTGISLSSPLSLFGKIGASARIEDIAFSDVSLNLTIRSGVNCVGAFANGIEAGASISNVSVSGISMKLKVNSNATVENIRDAESQYALFNDERTDDAVQTDYGITVSDKTLTLE